MNGRPPAILTYHSLDPSGSVISVSPDIFRAQMEFLASSGIPVVPLSEIRNSPGAVALTFDDGFRNFLDYAFPILSERRFPATVFVISGYCGKRNDWPGQSGNVPTLELMDWDSLRQIAGQGIELGGHTVNHPRLPDLSDSQVREELHVCRTEIEQRTESPAVSFAYPYGTCDPRTRGLVDAEFRVACGTRLDYVTGQPDPLELPRLDMYYFRSRYWFESLASPAGRLYVSSRRMLRELRQIAH